MEKINPILNVISTKSLPFHRRSRTLSIYAQRMKRMAGVFLCSLLVVATISTVLTAPIWAKDLLLILGLLFIATHWYLKLITPNLNSRKNISKGSRRPKINNRSREELRAYRLSVVTQFFPPDYAATGQLIEELVKELGDQGIDIKVFSGQPGYAYQQSSAPRLERSGNVTIVRSRTTNLWGCRLRGRVLNGLLFSVRAFLHLLRNCRRRDLVLFTTAPPFLPILGYLANVLFNMPYVCLLYNLYPDIPIELGVVSRHNWIARGWRALNRIVWRRANALIVLSPDMKQRIAQLCPEVADKVTVIHSWADPKKIKPIDKADNWFAREHGLVDKFTVLYSGNMGRCHDMDTIFEAALQLRDEPIQFVCIGGGAKKEALVGQVEAAGLTNVLFLPYQAKPELPYSLTACDLSLVSVSPGMESLIAPSKLYSALASGRPIAVICPSHSYLREMIEVGSFGACFDNGDSQGLAEFISILRKDPDRVEMMGRAARTYLESNHTPKIVVEQLLDVLPASINQSIRDSRSTHVSNRTDEEELQRPANSLVEIKRY